MKTIKGKNKIKLENKPTKTFEGVSYTEKMELIRLKNSFVTNTCKGNFFAARVNMIVKQLNNKKILENVDGKAKSKEYIYWEMMISKQGAISCLRQAYFDKEDMKKKGVTDEEIKNLMKDLDGPIFRENYDEGYRRNGKAEFVKEK